jgi:1-acyl-sn-glycerol-3-phosphate acyltransferase
MFYAIVKGMLSVLIWLFFKSKVFGAENVPKEGGVIIASNHVSYLDIPFLACGIKRNVDFIAKSELFRNRVFGWILKRLGTFPVKRGSIDRWAISEAIKRLGDGRVIVIYPEGARSKDGTLSDPKRGIGMLVALSGARVIPLYLMEYYRFLCTVIFI